jgi:NAD-dependent DNA ligase
VNRTEWLEDTIKEAAEAYYEAKQNPTDKVITDDAFDALVEELKVLDPTNPILSKPGWGYQPVGKKSAHYITPIGSLDKIKQIELKDKARLLPDVFRVEPKWDGGSAVCYYDNSTLEKIVSRGNGYIGVDITANLIHSVPQKLKYEGKVAVRGEIVITLEDFEQYLKPLGYQSPRNAAVGLSQAETVDPKLIGLLRFIACDIIGGDGEQDISGREGFEWVPYEVKTKQEFLDQYTVMEKPDLFCKLSDGKTAQTDGFVLKSLFGPITTSKSSGQKSDFLG